MEGYVSTSVNLVKKWEAGDVSAVLDLVLDLWLWRATLMTLPRLSLTLTTLINSRWHYRFSNRRTTAANGPNIARFALIHEFSLYDEDL